MIGKQTILYARLSQDDGSQGDSNSIQNQRLILEKYANDNGFENTIFLSDDGYSGTNFERPSFIQMMELIENGEVAVVIVKDLSRLGRNYLEVGRYTEIVFPSHDVRFIAINDGVDSLFESSNDFTPMRNWVNELTAKDTSKKIKASKRAKAGTGAYVGTMPPYGYKKDPLRPKTHLVIDESTAPVVERIFSHCMAGIGVREIAKMLTADKTQHPASITFVNMAFRFLATIRMSLTRGNITPYQPCSKKRFILVTPLAYKPPRNPLKTKLVLQFHPNSILDLKVHMRQLLTKPLGKSCRKYVATNVETTRLMKRIFLLES